MYLDKYLKAQIEYIGGGFKEVSEEIYQNRLGICQTCENYQNNKCVLCGCKCAGTNGFTSKLRLPHEKCPDNPPKWLEENIENKGV